MIDGRDWRSAPTRTGLFSLREQRLSCSERVASRSEWLWKKTSVGRSGSTSSRRMTKKPKSLAWLRMRRMVVSRRVDSLERTCPESTAQISLGALAQSLRISSRSNPGATRISSITSAVSLFLRWKQDTRNRTARSKAGSGERQGECPVSSTSNRACMCSARLMVIRRQCGRP